jgi:hypothetical protein
MDFLQKSHVTDRGISNSTYRRFPQCIAPGKTLFGWAAKGPPGYAGRPAHYARQMILLRPEGTDAHEGFVAGHIKNESLGSLVVPLGVVDIRL